MRLSNVTDAKLLELAEGHRRIGNPLMAGLLDELVDRRTNESPLKLSEMTFAYERAAGAIESHCTVPETAGEDIEGWYDLDTITNFNDVDTLDDEVEYLKSRGLLDFHPTNPRWVSIRDEGEGTA